MTNPPDREVAVFSAARRLPAGERAAYLAEACAGDVALRQRVEELLQASDEAGNFLESPAAISSGRAVPAMPAEKPGDKIGRYKLLQQIGEGGCGVVYMAEQVEPVHRRVALKVIKLGMDTKQVIARFEAERQVLALMDHPNIAKVLDAGATETGRPFFVMELVRGIKITDYCDQNDLSTRERLDLFIQVCHAIQHAHQKGIIHRDIKPSNILVTMNDGVPLPKVIDFGIAKATEGKLTDQTVFTAFEQFIGTPAYMSPEQAEMSARDVDTRSDIYSLGVLLYELLTGRTPFDAKKLLQAGLDEIRRTIRQDEPARPSTCLSTMAGADLTAIAKHRKAEPPKLIHLVHGDLDWIVMKALEKDRSRRYETANGLASDILRHINCEPVVARPPSRFYEFEKTVRRHKFGFAAATAILLVLLAGVIISTQEAIRARRAEQEQIRLRKIAEANELKAMAETARSTHLARGVVYLQNQNWQAAGEEYAQTIELDPADPVGDHLKAFYMAIGLLEVGRTNDYQQLCGKMLARYGTTDDYYTAERVAKACLLLPVAGSEFESACKLADFAAANHPESPWNCETKALAEYRRTHYSASTNWVSLSLSNTAIEPPCKAAVLFIQAAALAHLNDSASAGIALEQGDQVKQQTAAMSGFYLFCWDWMIAEMLEREARTALRNAPAGSAAPVMR